jgi:hypothetical protein
LHVPQISKNLISVQKFTSNTNTFFEFHPSYFLLKDRRTGKLLLHGLNRHGLYQFFPSANKHPRYAMVGDRVSAFQWHSRLGHPTWRIVHRVLSSFKLPVASSKESPVCTACLGAKTKQLPFASTSSSATCPLALIYTDVWGPAPVSSRTGAKYYVSFLDDYSKYTWLYPISVKSDVISIFTTFKSYVERFFNTKIKAIQSDWGGEYRPVNTLLQKLGIQHRVSCPHTHQQNGAIERKHRHSVETGLALLSHAHLPFKFWDDAFSTACYLINRMPTSVLQNLSPFETLFKCSPDYTFLRTFGCLCWPNLRPYNSNKFQPRFVPCLFLGYSPLHKGYKCLHLPTNRLYISRDVLFTESEFPYSSPLFPLDSHTSNIRQQISLPILLSPPAAPPSQSLTEYSSPSPSQFLPSSPVQILSSASSSTVETPLPAASSASSPSLSVPLVSLHPMVTRAKNNISKPREFTNGRIRYPLPRALLAESSPLELEPTCHSTVVKDKNWRTAMNTEFDAFLQNQTWTLVLPESATNIIGCKWVFRIKRKSDGSIDRYKARLVAKGFHQQPGIDYAETYSLVIKPTTVRIVLSLALSNGWPIHQIDIHNAFLHGTISEVVYMTQPPGFSHPQFPTHVCKLQKALYGLKQAPRAWFSRLSGKLQQPGFHGSKSDTSLFIYKSAAYTTLVLIYVDDILITSSKPSAVRDLLTTLQLEFAVKDLGLLHFFLGIEVLPCRTGFLLSQHRYIVDILRRTKMLKAKPINSPMASSTHLSAFEGDLFPDPTLYRNTVGALQYLCITRSDISFCVNKLAQFMHKPTALHWQAVERLLRYLKETVQFGLHFNGAPLTSIQAYADADWAGDRDDRRSTGGYCIFLGQLDFLEL